nr:M55 family metallopeptidase [Lactobacillus delbrueckii]
MGLFTRRNDGGNFIRLCRGNPYRQPLKKGVGSATVNKSPQEVAAGIATGIKEALAGPGGLPLLADEYLLEFCFSSAGRARAASFYPGAERAGERIVSYRAKSIMELLTAKMFMTEI